MMLQRALSKYYKSIKVVSEQINASAFDDLKIICQITANARLPFLQACTLGFVVIEIILVNLILSS